MNKIYKLKFCKTNNSLIAVSELATNAQSVQNSGLEASAESSSAQSLSRYPNKLNKQLITTGLTALSLSLFSLGGAQAAPTGAQVVSGSAEISTVGNLTSIVNSPNAIINWQSFNIQKNEVVKFIQENASSAVLNRVLGNEVSQILGKLQSNGRVFLVNPNGIIFGKESTVDVAGLVASTLDINNEDFKQGHLKFSQLSAKEGKIASVINNGLLQVNQDGSLALIGGQVVNNGVLEARNGSVYLLAGHSIEFADFKNPHVSFKVTAKNKAVNLGTIIANNASVVANKVLNGKQELVSSFADIVGVEADSAKNARIQANGTVLLYGGSVADQLQSTQQTEKQVLGEKNSLVVNNGIIDVTNKSGKAGKVQVLGDYVLLADNSKIFAKGKQGGQVRVGGDPYGEGNFKLATVSVATSKQLIDVSASGDAGNSIFWGNYAKVDGTFLAQSETGKGGLVETSGHGIKIADDIKVLANSLTANADNMGTWLIDPNNIFVVHVMPSDLGDVTKIETPENPESRLKEGSDSSYGALYAQERYFQDGYARVFEVGDDKDTYILDKTLETWLKESAPRAIVLRTTGNITFDKAVINTSDTPSSGILHLDTASQNAEISDDYVKINDSSLDLYGFWITSGSLEVTITNSKINTNYQTSIEKDGDDVHGSILINTTKNANITVNNSTISAKKLVTFTAGIGSNLNINNTTLSDGTFKLNAGEKVNIYRNDGNDLNISNASIRAKVVNITGTTNVNLNNIDADNTDNTLFKVNSENNNVSLTGDSTIKSKGPINITAISGAIDIKGAVKIETTGREANANILVKAQNKVNISLDNADSTQGLNGIVSVGKVDIISDNDEVDISGGQIRSSNMSGSGELLNISGKSFVTVAGTNIQALKDATIESKEKDVALRDGASVGSRMGNTKLAALNGNITVKNSKAYAANNLDLLAKSKVHTSDESKLYGKNVVVNASEGPAIIDNTKIKNASGRNADVEKAADNITILGNPNVSILGGSEINASKAVNITATTGDVNISGKSVVNGAYIDIVAKEGDAKVSDATLIGVSATNISGKNVSLTEGASVDTTAGKTFINATEKNVTLDAVSVKGKAIEVVADKGVTITGKSVLNSTGLLTEDTNSTLISAEAINIQGSSLISAANLNANATTSNLDLVGTDVSVGGNANLKAFTGNIDLQGSNISAAKDVNVFALPENGNAGDVEEGKGLVNLSNTNIKAGTRDDSGTTTALGNITIRSVNSVNLANSSLDATDKVNIKSEKKDITLANGTKIAGDNGVVVNTTEGTLGITGTNITSSKETVELKFKDDISIVNSNISGYKALNLKSLSPTGNVSLTDSSLVSKTEAVDVEGAGLKLANTTVVSEMKKVTLKSTSTDLTLENGTKVSGKEGVEVNATAGNLKVVGTNVTSDAKVDLNAKLNVTLANSNISGAPVNLKALTGKLDMQDNTVTSPSDAVTIWAKEDVTLGNNKVSSGKALSVESSLANVSLGNGNILTAEEPKAGADGAGAGSPEEAKIAITAANATVQVIGTNLTASDSVTIKAKSENLDIINSNISGKTLDLALAGDGDSKVEDKLTLNLTDSSIKLKEDYTLNPKAIVLANTSIASEKKLNVTAPTGDLTLGDGTRLTAGTDLIVAAPDGSLKATGTNLTAVEGKVDVQAKYNVTLTNTNISGQTATDVTSKLGNVTLADSNVHAITENVSISAPEGMAKVSGSNLTSDEGYVLVKSKEDAKVEKPSLLKAAKDVEVNSANASALVDGAGIEAGEDIKVIGQTAANVSNSKLKAGDEIIIKSNTSDVDLTNTQAVSKKDLTVSAEDGKVKLTNTKLNSTDGRVIMLSKDDLTTNNSEVKGTDVELKSKAGEVKILNHSNIDADNNVSITTAPTTDDGKGNGQGEGAGQGGSTGENGQGSGNQGGSNNNQNTNQGTDKILIDKSYVKGKNVTLNSSLTQVDDSSLLAEENIELKGELKHNYNSTITSKNFNIRPVPKDMFGACEIPQNTQLQDQSDFSLLSADDIAAGSEDPSRLGAGSSSSSATGGFGSITPLKAPESSDRQHYDAKCGLALGTLSGALVEDNGVANSEPEQK